MKIIFIFLIYASMVSASLADKIGQGDPLWRHAQIGMYAINTETGVVVADENSDLSFIPASTLKVVTTFAALELLGKEAHFTTTLEYDGHIDKAGVLQGNLYIHGGGDPCLGSSRTSSSRGIDEQLGAWTQAIEQIGIKKIAGKIIGDASAWEKTLSNPTWLWEDVGNYYGAGASALSFHENSYELILRPGLKEGERAAIVRTEPAELLIQFDNEVTTGPQGSGDRASIFGAEYSPQQSVRGTVPLGVKEFSIRGAIADPPAFCAHLLQEAVEKCGIAIQKKSNRNVAASRERKIIHCTTSPSVGEIAYWVNQKSINLYAEHLLKKMGNGATQAGIAAVTSFLKDQNIDISGLNMADGSGLSRKNLATPKMLVALLERAKKSPFFLTTLPETGKTGSMSQVRCRVGYKGPVIYAPQTE